MPHPRARSLLHSLILTIRILLILSFCVSSTGQVSFAAPQIPPTSKSPVLDQIFNKKLNSDDTLTVTANACALAIVTQRDSKIVLKCRGSGPFSGAVRSASSQVLNKGDKLTVTANGCGLDVTSAKTKKIVIICIGHAIDMPALTTTGTATRTRTPTRTVTRTRTSTGTATRSRTPTRTVTRTRTSTGTMTRTRTSTATRTRTATRTPTPPTIPPTIQLTLPPGTGATAGSSYAVKWTDSDPDDNASISLYLDDNNSGNDGILLVNNLREDEDGAGDSYTLDVSSLTPGDYYIYALIEDDRNSPAISYSPGKLTISPNAPTGTVAGSTAGNFDVNFLGAATYSIPISLSPGTAGMAPELALAYNSQSGNGLVGVGWNLSGLSVVSRCPATLAQDELNDGVDFDALDRLCLDGERLVLVSGVAYGKDGTKYRLEHEQFSDITLQGTRGAGPDAIVVRTKAGLILHYKSMVATGRSDALYWAVDRISDTSANYFTVTYYEDSTNGEYYPTRIDYTGNSNANLAPYNRVELGYENRADSTTQFIFGSKLLTTKRLSSIKTYAQGSLVREYRLAYTNGTVSNRSHLVSVTECGSDEVTCFEPTRFGWEALATKWGDLLKSVNSFWAPGSRSWAGHRGTNYFHGDFNGDGKHDLMTGTGSKQWKVFLSTGTNFDSTSGPSGDGRWFGGVDYQNNLVGDFDGDGKTDVMGFKVGTLNTWVVGLSSGSDFNKSGSGNWANGLAINSNSSPSRVSQDIRTGDFNGDGKDDLIKPQDPANSNYEQGNWRIVFSGSTSFSGGAAWSAPGTNDTSNIFVGDFNGDGKSDLITYLTNSVAPNCYWQVYTSTGSGFTKLSSSWKGTCDTQLNNVVADFNGDGKDDIASYRADADQNWNVCLSNGSGFDCSYWISGTPKNASIPNVGLTPSATAGDFNGDGKADIATQNSLDVQDWTVGISGVILRGDFNNQINGFWHGHKGGFERNVTGDFNRDGKMDLAGFAGGNDWDISLSSGTDFSSLDHYWKGANTPPKDDLSNVRAGDFNGDGRTDIATANGSNWNIAYSTGTNFNNRSTTGPVAGPNGTMANIVTGDFNGDGKTDVAGYSEDERTWHIAFANNDGTGLMPEVVWRKGPKTNAPNIIPGDFNGDGKTDLAAYSPDAKLWHVGLSSGTEFDDQGSESFWSGPTEGSANTIAGDFNGDGKTDLAASATPGKWHVFLSSGRNFKDKGLWEGHAGGAQNNISGDFNGDGLTDIAGFSPERLEWHVALSTGTSFSGVGTGFWKGETAGSQKTVVADFNGDGKSDLAGYSPTEQKWHVTAPGGFPPDLMTAITTGSGKTTAIYYNPLTNSNIYKQDNEATYPSFEFAGPLYVVSRFTQTNGIGGTNQYAYFNRGAKTNLRGRGFRGFREIRATDLQSGIVTITSFDRNHLYSGMPLQTITQLDTGVLVSVVINTLNFKDYGNKTYFSFIAHSQDETFEINNNCKLNPDNSYTCSPVKTIITEYVYNSTDVAFGNVSQVIVRTTGSFLTTTTNTYTNDTAKWLLGRLTKSDVKQTAANTPDIIRTSTFEYNPNTGLLSKEVSDPGKAVQITKTYGRDAFGNITDSTVSASGLADRTTTSVYDAQGRFAVTVKNALNHATTYQFDPLLGNVISSTTPNQNTTTFTYDAFGRSRRTTRPDSTITRQYYLLCASNCPNLAVYRVEERASGAPTTITYFDALDRPIRTETKNFNNQTILGDTVYDNQGRQQKISKPYVSGTSPLWHTSEYDKIGRQTKESFPDGTTQTTLYSGLTTTIINRNNQKLTKTTNAKGWLVQSKDTLSHSMSYTYDAVGNNLKITDPDGNTTTMQYDLANRRTQMIDPDSGTNKSTFNPFGELTSQTNNKGQTTNYTYDLLGRVKTRTSPEGTTTWNYDPTNGKGKPASISQPWSNYTESYTYDSLSRVTRVTQVVDGTTFATDSAYDFWGHPNSVKYPSGLQVRSLYHHFGNLASVRNQSTNKLYWELQAVSVRGQVTQEKFGDTSIGRRTYDAQTGLLKTIRADVKSATIQSLVFDFDPLGNLESRNDAGLGLTENFTYDALNRVTQVQLNGATNLTITYDALGNIKTKSDVGTYTYGGVNAGPHQVKSITGALANTYQYDANGNRIKSKNETIDYTSFNQPKTITAATASYAFAYGPDLNRIKQVATLNSTKTTTYYLGAMERRLSPNGASTLTEDLHYISGPNGLVVAISYKSQNGASLKQNSFLHLDHLGSIDTITDDNGKVQQKLSYDAWGRRRDAQTWQPIPLGALAQAKNNKQAKNAALFATPEATETRVPGVKKTVRAAATAAAQSKARQARRTARALTPAATPRVPGAKRTKRAATAAAGEKVPGAKKTARALAVAATPRTPGAKKTRRAATAAAGEIKVPGAKKTARAAQATPTTKKVRKARRAQLNGTAPLLNRGFTGHEHLDAVNLVNMNGRIYDPVIGRFLSADPFVQYPDFTQSYNRYSYVLNNPLSFTDPSGYFLSGFFHWIGKNWKSAATFVFSQITAVVSVIVLGPIIGPQAAYAFGNSFGNAFAGSILSGGSLGDSLRAGLRSGIKSAVTAAAFNFIGETDSLNPFEKIIAHGVVGGTSEAADGGKFQHGFLSAAAAKSFAPVIDEIKGFEGAMIVRVTAAAIVGGTASSIGGGKFSNGATTAIYSRLFNDEHDKLDKILSYLKPGGGERLINNLTVQDVEKGIDWYDKYGAPVVDCLLSKGECIRAAAESVFKSEVQSVMWDNRSEIGASIWRNLSAGTRNQLRNEFYQLKSSFRTSGDNAANWITSQMGLGKLTSAFPQ